MEMVPPVGWADVATHRDLSTLKTELESSMLAIEHRLVIWMVTTMAGGLALAITLARAI